MRSSASGCTPLWHPPLVLELADCHRTHFGVHVFGHSRTDHVFERTPEPVLRTSRGRNLCSHWHFIHARGWLFLVGHCGCLFVRSFGLMCAKLMTRARADGLCCAKDARYSRRIDGKFSESSWGILGNKTTVVFCL